MNKYIKYSLLLLALLLCTAVLFACDKTQGCDGNHTAGDWETVTEATCTTEGKQQSSCTKCGEAMERTLEATGKHTFSEWEVLKNATFSEEGVKTRKCTVCGGAEETEAIRALGAGAEVILSSATKTVDLSDFEIIYNDSIASSLLVDRTNELAATLYKKTGLEIPVQKQSDINDGGGLYEILIGRTNREESEEAFGEIFGHGYAVRVMDMKIVIVGSDDLQTITGLQYFINTYLAEPVEDGMLQMHESATAYNAPVVTLLSTGEGTQFEMVFDKKADNDPTHWYVTSSTSDSRDYPPKAAEELAALFESKGTLTAGSVSWHDDSTQSDFEILVGIADRPEAKSMLAAIDGGQYAILVTEQKVLLLAHCDYALNVCVERFKSLLNNAALEENGQTAWSFPLGFYVIGDANSAVVSDFTRPTGDGITLTNALYLNHNAMQYYYSGEGVNENAFLAYRQQLLSEGYRVIAEHEIQGSRFLTLVHDSKEVMLYVAYNAFSHAAEEHNRDDSTHVTKYPYLDYETCIRVVSAPLDSAYMPDEVLFTKQGYVKKTESSITTVRVQDAVGHAYIITLEDGTFVVIDGGSNTVEANTNVWNSLKALHEEIYGEAPSASNPVRVKAWYVTHSHGDHYGNFIAVMKSRVPTSDLKVEYMLGNFPERMSIYSVAGDTVYMGQDSVIANVKTYGGGTKYIKVYAGQVLYFANLKLEVLMTYADHAPRRIDNSNDTNTVTRLTFDGQGVSSRQTFVVLGDSCVYASRWLCAMYGSYLRSDIVQLAHHGNIGCEIALYKIIRPTVVWYPHSSSGFNSWSGRPTSNVWPYNVTNYVVRELDSVKYIYVEGVYGRSGTEALTLKLKADGTPDYDNIYNPITGSKYSYTTTIRVTTTPAIKK